MSDAAPRDEGHNKSSTAGQLYLLSFSVGLVTFALAFVWGAGYSIRTDHALPSVNLDFGLERLVQAQDYDRLIDQLQLILQIGSVGAVLNTESTATYHVRLADALQRTGQIDEAIAEYHTALELKPDCHLAHYNLGTALFAKGLLAESMEEFHRELAVNPRNAAAHVALGTIHEKQLQWDKAIASYEEALNIDGQLLDAHVALGRVLSEAGDEAGAKRHQETVRQLTPARREH